MLCSQAVMSLVQEICCKVILGLLVMTVDKLIGSLLIFLAVWLVIAPKRSKKAA